MEAVPDVLAAGEETGKQDVTPAQQQVEGFCPANCCRARLPPPRVRQQLAGRKERGRTLADVLPSGLLKKEETVVAKKTREDIVEECCKAVVACWNHYADKRLVDTSTIVRVKVALGKHLPARIGTRAWKAAAEEYAWEREKQDAYR